MDMSLPLYAHLSTIKANVFVSQSEPEFKLAVGLQPSAVELYPAIGTAVDGGYKELYVDKETSEGQDGWAAHTWCLNDDCAKVTGYNGGVTMAAITSFARRKLIGIDEPRMAKPGNVADWVSSADL